MPTRFNLIILDFFFKQYKRIAETFPIFILLFISFETSHAQIHFHKQDSLRGSNGIGRTGWDVLYYDITVQPDFDSKTIRGVNKIRFLEMSRNTMQIDLQQPMEMDSVFLDNIPCQVEREYDVFWIQIPNVGSSKKERELTIYFHGKPREAVRPPWDGGWVWSRDENDNPWMSVACQGDGASIWYPCKDIQSDEPDQGASLSIIVPDTLTAIGNGRLISTQQLANKLKKYVWIVNNPINNYNIVPYIGKYVHFEEEYKGLKGPLSMDYWVLEYNYEKAKNHFKDAPKTIAAFEHWMGPYPFYEDGYKLVEAPYLGMEHQSNVAYGNQYRKGYLNSDLSRTGWGLKWDYIIVHETGHEWFGNNITTKDIADMWVQEGFTTYSEVLYTDYHFGTTAGNEYANGLKKGILNDYPVIGKYGVNKEGSSDMYSKGAALIHNIRQVIQNDSLFRAILIGLNKKFYHAVVSTNDIENYISAASGINFSSVFDQYLRNNRIPILEYAVEKGTLKYRWNNAVSNFNLPLKIYLGKRNKAIWIKPSSTWSKLNVTDEFSDIQIDENFYVFKRRLGKK
ncbi:MAG: M1 family metallopeptidase [Ferruginibacter sp.]|nr:M1 family metallopeptidase [Ferruginibacter sp.]